MIKRKLFRSIATALAITFAVTTFTGCGCQRSDKDNETVKEALADGTEDETEKTTKKSTDKTTEYEEDESAAGTGEEETAAVDVANEEETTASSEGSGNSGNSGGNSGSGSSSGGSSGGNSTTQAATAAPTQAATSAPTQAATQAATSAPTQAATQAATLSAEEKLIEEAKRVAASATASGDWSEWTSWCVDDGNPFIMSETATVASDGMKVYKAILANGDVVPAAEIAASVNEYDQILATYGPNAGGTHYDVYDNLKEGVRYWLAPCNYYYKYNGVVYEIDIEGYATVRPNKEQWAAIQAGTLTIPAKVDGYPTYLYNDYSFPY